MSVDDVKTDRGITRKMASSDDSDPDFCRPAKVCKTSSSEISIVTRSKCKSQGPKALASDGYSWWQYLPVEALVRIYEHLRDVDRAKMSQVCKRWNEVFQVPSLWRERHFLFAGMRAMDATHRACDFVSNVGIYLRKMILECGHPVLHTARPIADALSIFLMYVGKSKMKLSALKIVYLDCYHSWRFFDLSRGKLITALCKFVKKQKFLRKFDISGAHFLSSEGLRILEALRKSQARKTLTSLHIKDIFEPRYQAFQDDRFRETLSHFTNLRQLFLNYIYLNGDTLAVLVNSKHLHHLRIVVDSMEPCNHTISPYTWREFSDCCPQVRVYMHFLGKLSLADYMRVLVRCVPACEIDILSWDRYPTDRNPDNEDMPQTLIHIAQTYTSKLVNFRLACDYLTNPPLDNAILMLIEKCTKLKDVCINTAIKLETVQAICDLLKKKRPRVIEHLELKVRDLSPDEVARLRNLAVLSSGDLGLRNIDVRVEEPE